MRGLALVISAVSASSVRAVEKLARSNTLASGLVQLPLASGAWRTTMRASGSGLLASCGAEA